MTGLQPVVLILGAGSNTGEAVASKFEAEGYHVAIASRSLAEVRLSTNRWSFKLDLSDLSSVSELYAKVSNVIGIPSVVVHNAYGATFGADADPYTVSIDEFAAHLQVNTASLYVAAKLAVEGFRKLPSTQLKTFIYTGNILNTVCWPFYMTLGVGKSASAHIIQSGALAYSERGYRFYYADERFADGSPVADLIDGQAHADHYFALAKDSKQGPWLSTFVQGKGYVKF